MTTVVVVIGGDAPDHRVVSRLPADRFVIAADSGFDHAIAMGLSVDLVVGDFDSVSPTGRHRIDADGLAIEAHPADKDHTDTELALRSALRHGARRIIVISSNGDRLDHSLGALTALASPHLATARVEAWWGDTHVTVVHGPTQCRITGRPGATVSLLPIGGPADGVTLSGTQYTLDRAHLSPTSSRTLSNVFIAEGLDLTIAAGTLLVIVPAALEGSIP